MVTSLSFLSATFLPLHTFFPRHSATNGMRAQALGPGSQTLAAPGEPSAIHREKCRGLRAAARLRMQCGRLKNQDKIREGSRGLGEIPRQVNDGPPPSITLGSPSFCRKDEEERAADAARRLFVNLKSKAKPQRHPESRPAAPRTKLKSGPHREAQPAPLRAAATNVERHEGNAHRHEEDEDHFGDDSSGERRRRSESPIFPGCAKLRDAVPPRCPECGKVGYPGCACMCMESMAWIEHEGGHWISITSTGAWRRPSATSTDPLAAIAMPPLPSSYLGEGGGRMPTDEDFPLTLSTAVAGGANSAGGRNDALFSAVANGGATRRARKRANEEVVEGAPVQKKARKERSDKGTTHASRDQDANGTGSGNADADANAPTPKQRSDAGVKRKPATGAGADLPTPKQRKKRSDAGIKQRPRS
ncbi:hypothetical protein B0H19DRAFT_1058373 [Mycena capillaripes]|nr:hypothetical protein B0H19DRAFT_1066202 [Mycena capillaripes]KAJ6589346.1 hypothetical protein B0H19DRAFT_1058373 [Mycena capillaripes]